MEKDINVFINCPYDKEYAPMKQALMFAVIYCGFEPQLVSMIQDAGDTRLEKIKKLITTTQYGIHDISRCRASKKNEWYRLNMPFEMGLDFGYQYFSSPQKDKRFLVLANKRYSLQPALSDFSGNDPQYHDSDDNKLIRIVRNFFYSEIPVAKQKDYISISQIVTANEAFQTQLYKDFQGKREDILDMQDNEYCDRVKRFKKVMKLL